MPTPSTEDYLKAIYMLSEKSPTVSTGDLAQRLAIKPASVSGMVKKLALAELIEYESHKGVILTAKGKSIALEVIRHHRLLESFLHGTLGFPLSSVHAEAENLEHHISEEFEERIANLLGDPQFDPHGHPIPDRKGNVPLAPPSLPLGDAPLGVALAVVRLDDADPPILDFLESHKLLPGSHFTILSKEVSPELLRIATEEEVVTLTPEVIRRMRVATVL